jgi:hypothetical protein
LITTRTKLALTDTFQKLKNQSILFGLIVNEQKSKYLKCPEKKMVSML